MAQGPEHLDILRGIAPASMMVLPLMVRGELFGTLTFISSVPTQTYQADDLWLAQAVAERAALAIENARLYRASIEASRLRDDVLGVVAHDLRTPLTNILLQVAALKRGAPQLERRSQRPTEVILQSATRMNRLIQDLLDVAKLEAGHFRVDRVELQAREVLAEAVELERQLAAGNSVALHLDCAAELPRVWADRDRLFQVFENLIGNAVKFTAPGGRVTVGARHSEGEVVFWVSDTGQGIVAEHLPHVFERFWQASRHAGRLGAGLGLAITRGIVEAHGGTIRVESEAGQGTTFSFTLPTTPPSDEHPQAVVH
jgi:signal transduction histidine kinase